MMWNMLDEREIQKIDGWLSLTEAEFLYTLAKHTSNGIILEIGTWKGKSTACLAFGSLDGYGVPIYTVDHFMGSKEHQRHRKKIDTYNDFISNMKQLGLKNIIVYKMSSMEAYKRINENIGLLFIDGSHEYEDVKNDFVFWTRKLVKGGVVVMHDAVGWKGVERVVKEHLRDNKNFKDIKLVDTTIAARKT